MYIKEVILVLFNWRGINLVKDRDENKMYCKY